MDAFVVAVEAVFEPTRLLLLVAGVVAGLVIGVIPGLSGIFGLALLVPLTYGFDPYAAMALLLGLGSVTTTSDTIPAVLVGVPGTVGAVATVEDGFPLAKQGQARRAFGAAYSASLIGGLFGALVLMATIPVMRPLILAMRTPDFLAISAMGLLFVSILSGSRPLQGVVVGLLGLLCAQIGVDGQTAAERFTFGQIYLWDGFPLAVVFLGLFGLPELAGLLSRGTIARPLPGAEPSRMVEGLRDTLREWRLVLAGSSVGAILGAIPGIGVVVIEWVAYGLATRRRNGGPAFGSGNIRGVIAPEAANNAKEGGALIPTIAFGLPGSATMSILLGAFVIHGLVPGPAMLNENLSVTYAMVILVALANLIGAAICLQLTGVLSRVALLSARVLVPVALVFVVLGAYQTTRSVEDILVLCLFGLLGMALKALDWPRAPFALGFVLGPMIERYYFLSRQLTGWEWLTRPSVLIVAALFLFVLYRRYRAGRNDRTPRPGALPPMRSEAVAFVLTGLLAAAVLMLCRRLPDGAEMFPVNTAGLLGLLSLLGIARLVGPLRRGHAVPHPAPRLPLAHAAVFAMIAGFTLLLHLGGIVLATVVTVSAVVLSERPRRPGTAVLTAAGCALVVYLVFDVLMSLPWPRPWLAAWLS